MQIDEFLDEIAIEESKKVVGKSTMIEYTEAF
jgi:hypothetical protein